MNKPQKVIRVTRSPLSLLRWALGLACGHEAWVTRAKRPTAKSALCPRGCGSSLKEPKP
jgi:hypothetical protein